MKTYQSLMKEIYNNGIYVPSRTGVSTYKLFGTRMEFDMSEGFPLLTTQKVFFKGVVEELLWFLSGSTNINDLNKRGVKFWDRWANESGSLGPMYGEQFRLWRTSENKSIDQISELLANLISKPFSRRHVVSSWNPEFLPNESISPQENVNAGKMALAPCHGIFQCDITPISSMMRNEMYNKGKPIDPNIKYGLSIQMYQRSADFPVGVPFNIACYSLLLHLISHCLGFHPLKFIWVGGDTHIYENQMESVHEQINRTPFELPKIIINPEKRDLFSFTYDDIKLIDYKHHNHIVYPVSV